MFGRLVKYMLLLALAAVMVLSSSQMSHADCEAQQKVARFAALSEAFFYHLDALPRSGLNPAITADTETAALALHRFQMDNPVVELRHRLLNSASGHIDVLFGPLATSQKALLQVYFRYGPEQTKKTAERLQTRSKLATLQVQMRAEICVSGTTSPAGVNLVALPPQSGAQGTSPGSGGPLTTILFLAALGLAMGVALWRFILRMRRREVPRKPCPLPCEVTYFNRARRAQMVDLSTTGARITVAGCFKIGDPVYLKVKHIGTPAEITWAEPVSIEDNGALEKGIDAPALHQIAVHQGEADPRDPGEVDPALAEDPMMEIGLQFAMPLRAVEVDILVEAGQYLNELSTGGDLDWTRPKDALTG